MTKPGEHKSGCKRPGWEDRGSLPLGLLVQECTGCGVRRTSTPEIAAQDRARQIRTITGLTDGLGSYCRARAETLLRLARQGEYSDEAASARIDELTLVQAELERLMRRASREVADGQEG